MDNIVALSIMPSSEKEIKIVKVDKATMDYYTSRLTNFIIQFQAIGNNYNQLVKSVEEPILVKKSIGVYV